MRIQIALLVITAIAAGCGPQPQNIKEPEAKASTPDASPRGDGPFGLNLKARVADLSTEPGASQAAKGLYILKSVPAPSDDFSTYAVIAFDGAGICEIRAIGEDNESDSLGVATKAAVDRVAESLSSKYGNPRKIDSCGGGSVSCQNQFWAMSVMNGERAYGYLWEHPKPPLRSIGLSVSSDDLARLSMRLDYETGDAKECKAAANKAGAANL